MIVLLIIAGVLMLLGLVILHEFGHFLAARRSGVDVEEFGIGFPPKAKTLGVKNGTEYTLNWLPLGGFVRLKGEHDADTKKGTFGAASLRDKVKIMMAGVAVNLAIAVVLLSIVALAGLPTVLRQDNGQVLDSNGNSRQFFVASDSKVTVHDVVISVAGDTEGENASPASEAGLGDGDTLLSLTPVACDAIDATSCGLTLERAQDLFGYTSSVAGEEVVIEYIDQDDDQAKTATATFRSEDEVQGSREARSQCAEAAGDDEGALAQCPAVKGYFGVAANDYIERRATWSAPIVATVFSAQIVQETLVTFGQIFREIPQGETQTAQDNLVGVVGIGYVLGEIAARGVIALLFLTAIISLSLALMNALPIPALDGGRLFVTLLFRVIKKPLTKDLEERIHGTGFAALMLLFLLITVLDVQRFVLG